MLTNLTQLKTLDFSFNQIAKIPAEIVSLTQLKTLILEVNQIEKIPVEIASLTQLQSLYLSANPIREIPAKIASLTQLQALDLNYNPLNPDLAAAYEQGIEAVMQYLRAQAEAEVTLNEAKLILIGGRRSRKNLSLGCVTGR